MGLDPRLCESIARHAFIQPQEMGRRYGITVCFEPCSDNFKDCNYKGRGYQSQMGGALT